MALKDEYDVSLVTGGELDLESLNAFYGTSLKPGDFSLIRAPIPRWLRLLRRTGKGDALGGIPYARLCREIAGRFDVLISTYNFCDFGVPAIHRIADFCWDDEIRRSLHPAPPGMMKVIYGDNMVRKAYLALSRSLHKPSGHNVFAGEDLIIANSRWTADLLHFRYGTCPEVLYSPVSGAFPAQSWGQRENGFVCLGRIDPVKRIERLVRILDAVRRHGHDVHLHIIGRIGNDAYGRSVADLCRAHAEWIFPEGLLFGQAKIECLTRHRYAIHGCNGEAFGIAVAEMVKAGCIPFVPQKGGQAEIVNHPLLTYDNEADAVEKIVNVLESPPRQDTLREHLLVQGRLFSAEAFMTGLRDAVAHFAGTRHKRQ